MCGIAGYRTSQPVMPNVLNDMVEALYHRGPDASGYYHGDDYHAGMRRLRINDIRTGDQPLFNEDKTIVLLYNGEIYNSPDLRRKLEQKGHLFKTHTDGEVICHLYEEFGDLLFEKLDGMFAIALWIAPEKKLFLARDLPGEKPLYYHLLSDKELLFASEIKSITKFPYLNLTINEQAVWDFPTFLWIPEPQTIYDQIKALPRGHILQADSKGIIIRSYVNKFNTEEISGQDDFAYIEETKRVVTEAVHSRLLSDVPVGSFLSSGLDSSIISLLSARRLSRLDTFSIAFDDVADPYHGHADESADASIFAKEIGSKHHEIRVNAADFRRDLSLFCKHGDEPFAVSSGLGILSIARTAHEEGIKVLLSGDGADECFGGYSWYPYLKGPSPCQPNLSNKDNDESISFQNFGLDLDKRLESIYSYHPAKRAWAWHYYASEYEKTMLYNMDRFTETESSLRFFEDFKSDEYWKPEDYIKQDRNFYFPYEMLRKMDRMTMAFSVEGRVPFAAPAVLSHAEKLRFSHMIRDNQLKWILRRAFEDILPKHIIDRPKHGFNVPIDHWLKGEWSDLFEDTFSSASHLMKLGFITNKSRNIALNMLNHHMRLNGHTIFCYIMLNLWLENNYGNHC